MEGRFRSSLSGVRTPIKGSILLASILRNSQEGAGSAEGGQGCLSSERRRH